MDRPRAEPGMFIQPHQKGEPVVTPINELGVPRRTFLKLAGLGAAGAALNQTMPSSNDRPVADLPDYAPVPKSALGPALNPYALDPPQLGPDLYWVTGGTRRA